VAARLRRHQLAAQTFFIGLWSDFGWIGGHYCTDIPTDDAKQLMRLCYRMLGESWPDVGVHQVQVTATDPRASTAQPDMFSRGDPKRTALNKVMDAINNRYGEFAAAPARLIDRSSMPNVISPAWKPHGHRQTI
jgi:DNA polymerase-4